MNDGHFALTAGTFELDHVGRKRENVYGTDNAGTAVRTTVSNRCVFGVKNHHTKFLFD
jgi:hypothetical protein